MNCILEEMNKANAEGVDFIPIMSPELNPPIIASYTKEELINVGYYPKSNRRYWRMVDGKKIYCK